MGRHFDRGIALYQLDRFREAAGEFTQELADGPQSPHAHLMRGACQLRLKQYKYARSDFETAIAMAPDWSMGYYWMSIWFLSRRKVREADRMIREALRIEPDPDYFIQLARVELAAGHLTAAMEATEEALRLDPNDVNALVLRAELLSHVGQHEQATELLQKALAESPENATVHQVMGNVRLESGSAAHAVDHLREARRLDPMGSNDRAKLAMAYGRLRWPYRYVFHATSRLVALSPQGRWAAVCGVMSLLVVVLLATRPSIEHFAWGAAGVFAAAANLALLLKTYSSMATFYAYLALRRELDVRWRDISVGLLGLPMVLLGHAAATLAAGVVTAVPPLVYFLFAMILLNWDACWLVVRLPFVVALLMIPVLGMAAMWLVVPGTTAMPNNPLFVMLHWVTIVVVSGGLLLVRLKLQPGPSAPLSSATPAP